MQDSMILKYTIYIATAETKTMTTKVIMGIKEIKVETTTQAKITGLNVEDFVMSVTKIW